MKKLLVAFLTVSLLSCALPALAAEEVNVFNWEDYICDEV
ncbi:MAG TPA: spermidine/putrescine ABC transporter substrate-binding protein PotD, partial [Candidatus Aphodomonas merdavium]|nr:spermidine/putrescine ABC transporter substrate-binding protein PotD [Candidatus Aphodomonas merdavium]